MSNMRNEFDCTPEQYHHGLDILWKALGVTGTQDRNVFQLAADELERLGKVEAAARCLLQSWEQAPTDSNPLPHIREQLDQVFNCL